MTTSALISKRAFTILTFFFVIGTSILIAPGGLAAAAKQDAWIAALLGVLFNLAMAWGYAALAERHPDRTLVGICELLLGKWPGRLAGLSFVLFCYLLAALMIGDMGYFLTSQIMTDTPTEALQLLFVAAVVLTVSQGMTGYARTSEVLFPIVLLLFLLFLFPLLTEFQFGRMEPVLEFGLAPVWHGGRHFFALQELAVLMMLYPFVSPGKGRSQALLLGTALGGFVLVFTTVGSIGVLDDVLTANNIYPVYTLAKNIRVGMIIERIEGLMIFIWVCSIFLKVTITFDASLIGFMQIFAVKEKRVFVWPLALGMIVLSLICYTSVFFIQEFLVRYWMPFAFLFLVVLPGLLFVVSLLRGGKGKGAAASQARNR